MMTHASAVEIVMDKVQKKEITIDQANVLIVKLMGVQIVTKLPASVRKALNAAVKNGEIGHYKKDGLKPEVYFHNGSIFNAKEIRNKEALKKIECLKNVMI